MLIWPFNNFLVEALPGLGNRTILQIQTSGHIRDYLEPGPPRLTSSLTASCFSLILLTMLVSSSLSLSVSWSTGGMATHRAAQLRLTRTGQSPRTPLGLQPPFRREYKCTIVLCYVLSIILTLKTIYTYSSLYGLTFPIEIFLTSDKNIYVPI